jgi:hypothetical protein
MTEQEWLGGSDPRAMLDQVRDRLSERKLRWFACGCVRQVWENLVDERSQQAVEVAERYAEGLASLAELAGAEAVAFQVARLADLRATVSDPGWAATRAAARVANFDAYSAASGAAFIAALCAAPWSFAPSGAVEHHGDPLAKAWARRQQCDLLREIAGNPFRPVLLRPEWLTSNSSAVLRLAEHIYQEGCFDELPVLGDALEEAGCTEPRLLEHCRRAGGHVRGCWVLDLVLGRK